MSNKPSTRNDVSIRNPRAAKAIKKASTIRPDIITKPEKTEESAVRVLKSATCPSLSGKSKLTYEVGCAASKELVLRIVANSGAGAFCQDWVELRAIRTALDRAPRNETITSDLLVPMFRERSANMPGFLWSLLLHEGLLRRSEKEKRRYERVEPEVFDAKVKALMEGKGAGGDAKATKAKGNRVAPEKTPSAATKRKRRSAELI
jgi:hypothetical protein